MKITLNFSLFRTKRRDKTENQPGQPLFVTSSLRLATRLSGLLSVSTVRNYHTALRSFSSFLDGTDIPVHSLTPHLVSLYADWLTDRGAAPTRHRATYGRCVRCTTAWHAKVARDASAPLPMCLPATLPPESGRYP